MNVDSFFFIKKDQEKSNKNKKKNKKLTIYHKKKMRVHRNRTLVDECIHFFSACDDRFECV